MVGVLKEYIDSASKMGFSYEAGKIVSAIKERASRFDKNDWSTVIEKSKDNAVIAIAAMRSEFVPEYVANALMDIYKYNECMKEKLCIEVVQNQVLMEEITLNAVEELYQSGKMKEMCKEKYVAKQNYNFQLSRRAARQLFRMVSSAKISEYYGMPHRYYDYINNPDRHDMNQIVDDVKAGYYSEAAIAGFINNPTITSSIKNKLFDVGCDLMDIEEPTQHMIRQIYTSCIESVCFTDALHTPNRDAMILLDKMIAKGMLPKDCQIDLVMRNQEIKDGEGLLKQLYLSTQDSTVIELLADIDTVGYQIAKSTLLNKRCMDLLEDNIKEKKLEEMIEHLHTTGILKSQHSQGGFIAIANAMKQCPLSDKAYETLVLYQGQAGSQKDIVVSAKVKNEIINELINQSKSAEVKLYGEYNLLLRSYRLNKHIESAMNLLILEMFQNEKWMSSKDKYQNCVKGLNKSEYKRLQKCLKILKDKTDNCRLIQAIENASKLQKEYEQIESQYKEYPNIFKLVNGKFYCTDIEYLKTPTEIGVDRFANMGEDAINLIISDIRYYANSICNIQNITSVNAETRISYYENVIPLENTIEEINQRVKELEKEKKIEEKENDR